MSKYLVQVTIYLQIQVEAKDMDKAEHIVRNMGDAELFCDDVGSWPRDYEVFELDEEGEIIEPKFIATE